MQNNELAYIMMEDLSGEADVVNMLKGERLTDNQLRQVSILPNMNCVAMHVLQCMYVVG